MGDMGELNMIMENVINIACRTFIKMPAHMDDEFTEMRTISRWTASRGTWGQGKSNMFMENVINIACRTFIKIPADMEDEFMNMRTITR